MIDIDISEDARSDLSDGFWFYEAQEKGAGDYFASCLKNDIRSLQVTAGIHRILYRDYHRVLSRRFPYSIYYTLENGVATIWAIIDCRRDPEWIRDRLSR